MTTTERLRAALPAGLTLLAGAVGGFLFLHFRLPLPWILGSIFGVVAVSRIPRLPLARPPRVLLNPVRAAVGLAIGTAFVPAMLAQIGQYAVSLVFLVPFVAATGGLGWIYFRTLFRFDSPTAFLCAMPGGIAELILLGEDMGADIRRIALIHGMRVIALVYTMPFLATWLTGVDIGARTRIMPMLADTPVTQLVLMVLVATAGWWVFKVLRLSGASIIGPMVAAALCSLAGLIGRGPPNEVLNLAQWILGTSVGAVFIGYGTASMARLFLMGLGQLVILGGAVTLTAFAVTHLTDFDLLSTLLAFAPGGQAETALIAMTLQADVGYVATHHLLRLVLIMSIIPVIFRGIFRPGGKEKPHASGSP